ncbi:MAG: hypothetical protein CTY16_01025 [Methylobacter sp.]|nr:MAG: hypothetical protein CTY16_01025 [Methylobacter sp.]
MATLEELAERLRAANPNNEPMALNWMAEQFWPDAEWLEYRSTRHNGGARRGALAAAGMAGRMSRRGLLKRYIDVHSSCRLSLWKWLPNKAQ